MLYGWKHWCPVCGRLTYGTPTEGGLTWAICEECYERLYSQRRREVEEEIRAMRRRQLKELLEEEGEEEEE